MTTFLEYVLEKLVEYPADVSISKQEDDKSIEFVVSLHPDDIGKVIGRHGKTIGAIRMLVNAAASRQGKRATVEVNDPNSSGAPQSAAPEDEPTAG